MLPVSTYEKINKLLRNLIIFSSTAIEETQIEVYVQNSDSFIDVISNCLKYINSREVIPYDLINLLLTLIKKISLKAKQIMVEVPIPQFLNLFEQILEALKKSNQFELWVATLQQF